MRILTVSNRHAHRERAAPASGVRRTVARIGLLLLVAAMCGPEISAAAAGRPLLWRVTGCSPGPSYVFGLLHSEDPRVTALPPPVLGALDRSARLLMAVLPTPTTLAVLGAESFAPTGAGLRARLGPGLFAATARRIAPYGVPRDLLRHMRPWAVVATLSLPRPRASLFQEFVVFLRARAAHKPAVALLDPTSEIAKFEALPERAQVALVRAVVRRRAAVGKGLTELRHAYVTGDLAALAKLRTQYPPFRGDPVAARAFRTLLRVTARRLVPRLLRQLRGGSRFAAITALNLPGAHGVLQGLRAGGCTLQRVGTTQAAVEAYRSPAPRSGS